MEKMLKADLQSSPKRLQRVLATIIIYNRTGNVFALLCDFSDQLGEDLSIDLEAYDLYVEPETFINSVFVLMEKELENMDVSGSTYKSYASKSIDKSSPS